MRHLRGHGRAGLRQALSLLGLVVGLIVVWEGYKAIGLDWTIEVATSEGAFASAPDDGAFTNEYAEAALKLLADRGVDATGSGFSKTTVTLNEGGN